MFVSLCLVWGCKKTDTQFWVMNGSLVLNETVTFLLLSLHCRSAPAPATGTCPLRHPRSSGRSSTNPNYRHIITNTVTGFSFLFLADVSQVCSLRTFTFLHFCVSASPANHLKIYLTPSKKFSQKSLFRRQPKMIFFSNNEWQQIVLAAKCLALISMKREQQQKLSVSGRCERRLVVWNRVKV